MNRGNVLVIGNSGVGKSTLINAVLGEECAKTGWGTEGTTGELALYESEELPFRMIDTVGFEPSLFKEAKAIRAVKKWSRKSAKEGKEDTQINVIWFCVEGTTSKLFGQTIKNLARATSIWKSVPVIVVITKSYSALERQQNVEMVYNAFAKQKHFAGNLKTVIPVVAQTYQINETAFAPQEGIIELITATNELMPEGFKAAEQDIATYKLASKRGTAHGLVAAAAATGSVVGAVPIPIADALILSPIEIGMVNAIARIYQVKDDEKSRELLNTIVEVGTVSVAARSAISAIKAIPGINLAASALNAVIAGSMITALGEGTIYVFEQIYLGNKSLSDVDWVKKIMESQFSSQIMEISTAVLEQVTDPAKRKDIGKIFSKIFRKKK